jgi:hypothetical protein
MSARDDVLAILNAAARKLWIVRAAEGAAVGAIAGGLCAAAGEMAWTIGRAHGAAAAVVCAAPLLFAAWLARSPRLGRTLGLGAAAPVVGAICAACGLMGIMSVATGLPAVLPKLALPLILAPAGAVAGALAAAARGVTPVDAGLYHDVALSLDEQLSTAADLAASGEGDEPLAQCVYAQALAAAQAHRPQHRPVWRRTPRTAGALGLSVALCVAVAFLPTLGATEVEEAFSDIRARAATMPAARQKDLVETLRRLARQVRHSKELRRALLAAAAAREAELPEKLEELEAALADADTAEAARIARAILRAIGAAGGPGEGSRQGGARHAAGVGDGNQPAPPDPNSFYGPAGRRRIKARAYVYHPSYEDIRDANASPVPTTSPSAKTFVRLDDAWTRARARAVASLAQRRVPAPYRRLVRRFFELD